MVLIRFWALRFLSIFAAGQCDLLASAYVVSKVFVHHGWIPESVDSQFQTSMVFSHRFKTPLNPHPPRVTPLLRWPIWTPL
jgi:hypothetical protein